MTIKPENLVMVCCSDIAGQVRGKGFPARDLEARWRLGVGWTPTNVMINCLGRIPATPFGPFGDLLLVPDPAGEVRLDFDEGVPAEHFILGDVLNLDGSPWDCCLRSLLKRAVTALEQEAGLRIYAAFEHEFHYWGGDTRTGDSYALSAMRGSERFCADLLGALRANGLEPDTLLPEYGPQQYEVTVAPAYGVEAADRAVKVREICRAVARRHEGRVSFSPVVSRGVVGNGVHVHFSLSDLAGHPLTHDAAGPGGVSAVAGAFAAGVLRHAPALCAVTAAGVLSYERLRPHTWSAFWNNFGLRDREAMLRICPVPQMVDIDPAPRFNLEYRAADATASPYMVLAMLVFAGLQGVRENLSPPPITERDPEQLTETQRTAMGLHSLPRSLGEALDALEADALASGWLGPVLTEAYLMHKRAEAAMLADTDAEEIVRLYAEAY